MYTYSCFIDALCCIFDASSIISNVGFFVFICIIKPRQRGTCHYLTSPDPRPRTHRPRTPWIPLHYHIMGFKIPPPPIFGPNLNRRLYKDHKCPQGHNIFQNFHMLRIFFFLKFRKIKKKISSVLKCLHIF